MKKKMRINKIFLAAFAILCVSAAALIAMERPAKRPNIEEAEIQKGLNRTLVTEISEEDEQSIPFIKYLLDAGASPNILWKEYPILHLAMFNPEIVQELINHGVNVQATDDEGLTALSTHKHDDLNPRSFELLIKAGADVNAKGPLGNTPLHFQANSFLGTDFAEEILRVLLKAGAQVNGQNDKGKTPLHYAVQNAVKGPHGEVIIPELQVLIDAGADVSIKDKKGRTPLDLVLKDTKSEDKIEKIRTLVTAVTPQEVQHIVPMMILLRLKLPEEHGIRVPKDIRNLLKDTFIKQLVNDMVKFAKQYLPNDSEDLLETLILKNIITALKKSPPIKTATEAAQLPTPEELLGLEPMDTKE